MNILLVFSSENNAYWRSHKRYFLPNLETKDYNVIIDGRNFFDQPLKNDKWIYDNIQNIKNGHEDEIQLVVS